MLLEITAWNRMHCHTWYSLNFTVFKEVGSLKVNWPAKSDVVCCSLVSANDAQTSNWSFNTVNTNKAVVWTKILFLFSNDDMLSVKFTLSYERCTTIGTSLTYLHMSLSLFFFFCFNTCRFGSPLIP